MSRERKVTWPGSTLFVRGRERREDRSKVNKNITAEKQSTGRSSYLPEEAGAK